MRRCDYDDDYGDYKRDLINDRNESIDYRLLNDRQGPVLVSKGWTKINGHTNCDYEWLKNNITDEYKFYYCNWYFKNQKDAVLFKLTWCS